LSASGTKLSESLEAEIERQMAPNSAAREEKFPHAALEPVPQLLNDYIDFLVSIARASERRSHHRLVVDCANGSASRVAPEVLRRLGFEARILNSGPNGRNINLECGALHPQKMAEETRA